MTDTRTCLYTVGDFVGFVEHIDRARKPEMSEQPWYLVQVSDGHGANSHAVANVDFLRRMQIDFYRPLMRRMKPVPKKKLSRSQRNQLVRPLREKIAPFFPGYAFLTFTETDDRWREVFKMSGIRGLVCANNRPVEVPWQMIKEIQEREIDGALPSATKLFELPYLLGEYVRITSGPFASFTGQIERLPIVKEDVLSNMTIDDLDESHLVNLLVDIFGRPTPVALSLTDIEKM